MSATGVAELCSQVYLKHRHAKTTVITQVRTLPLLRKLGTFILNWNSTMQRTRLFSTILTLVTLCLPVFTQAKFLAICKFGASSGSAPLAWE